MIIKTSKRYKEGYCYECSIISCRKRKSIKSCTEFDNYRIALSTQLEIIWYWGLGLSNYAIVNCCDISSPTLLKFKGFLKKNIENELVDNVVKIGGIGKIIQIN